jgi:hypothetical protein
MRHVLRHLLVLTVAFALVASAAAWRQCTGLQLAAAAAANSEHGSRVADHHAQTAGHGEHDPHAMHAQHGMADPGPPVADDHGCMKCCSMCTVANAVLPAADTTVVFTISAHVFSRDHEAWSGNTVAVDPGIPKRIV